ncbi:MAG: 30S ribosome-binding factor RbfA [Dethiobacter sp.]|jgi:ribosome-binding factor A|nr:MAG: 30S ribosome-binding factor RbfA [Dethiobacter sp.]
MAKQRSQRVGEQIKKEVSEILRLGLKDPGLINLTSVTDVEVSRDLRYAKIFVSIFGNVDEQEKILKILDKAKGFIRSEIGKRIRLRLVPEIEFHLDRSMEYGARIEGVLRDLGIESGAEKPK